MVWGFGASTVGMNTEKKGERKRQEERERQRKGDREGGREDSLSVRVPFEHLLVICLCVLLVVAFGRKLVCLLLLACYIVSNKVITRAVFREHFYPTASMACVRT